MSFLWSSKQTRTDEQIMRFLAGDDVVLDRHLLLYDMQATAAHAVGLARIGILTEAESSSINAELETLAEQYCAGDLVLDEHFEDGHSAIEFWLAERLGPVGEKVHTGRSRNDQVLVATRLFMRDALNDLSQLCQASAESCLIQARDYRHCPMPGYTHMQRAVVSSVGMWFAAFAEAFIDNAVLVRATRSWIDANP
ncbi:MAG: lyase family protein, partial [Gammaproteobacteria bacterium]|nr:lyase family protein [Gammaproteobacteria bacterium]